MSIISSESTNLEAAFHYSSLGYKVFPVHGFINGSCTCCKSPCPQGSKPGKHPACTHGYKDATVDQGQITLWFSGQHWLNVGIALDEQTMGLDVDPAKGGLASLEALEREHGPLPQTPKVLTGSKGSHLYYRLPPGVVVKSKAGWAPGIDTRSLGGYLIAPPSLHECGGRYEWLEPLTTPLAMAPDWLLKIVAEKPVSTPSTTSGSMGFGLVVDQGPCDFPSHPGAPEGKRHQELIRLAGIHLARGDSLRSIEAMATSWGSRCTPPCEPEGLLQKVRGLARKEAGKEGINSEARIRGVNSFLPLTPEPESKPEAPIPQSLSPFPSNPEPEHGLCLMKKDFANPLAIDKCSSMSDTSYSVSLTGEGLGSVVAIATSQGKGFGFGLVAQEEGVRLGDGAQEVGQPHEPAVELEPEAVYSYDTASVEPQEDWPELGPEAYHGLMGSIVKAVAPETESDPVAVLLSLATALGSCMGKGPHFALASGVHHANLFSSIVGDTASGKGQSWGVVHKLMAMADPEWEASAIAYGLSSGEGLVDRVKDSEEPQEVGFFPSIPEVKSLLCVETEFSKPITAMRREGNTLSRMARGIL